MNYTDLIADFAYRTIQNLNHVQEEEVRGNANVYPVTQLWNSLLGLIVLPRERDIARIPEKRMSELHRQGWPRLATTAGNEPETLRVLVKRLRNAVAHYNVDFVANADREITAVKVWNHTYSRNQPAPGRSWEGRITVTDLDLLARQIAAVYREQFGVAAA